MEIVSATATRRDVFAMMPTGLAAVANSDIVDEDTFMWVPERALPAIARGAKVAVDHGRPRDHYRQEDDTEPQTLRTIGGGMS
jgi:hypothetical protein